MKRISDFIYSLMFMGLVVVVAVCSLPDVRSFSTATQTPVLNGKLAQAFEKHYDKNFPFKEFGTNLWAAIDYSLFGEGRPGVVVGRNNWLFTDEEFKPASKPEQFQDNWALVSAVQAEFKRRGVTLVLALLPAKARLYPEHLGQNLPVVEQLRLYPEALARMQQAKIAGPELLSALQQAKAEQQVFMRTDTHWSPFGAQVVADSLAAYLRQTGHWQHGGANFVTATGSSQTHKGDLLSFLPLEPYFTQLQPPAEPVQLRSTAADEASQGDLFASQETPIALVGTSYSANPKWNFAGALKQALGTDLISYAEDGHGPLVPMLRFLQRPADEVAGLRLLIWEVPERYLNMPSDLSEFDPAWLAQLKAGEGLSERLALTAVNPVNAP
ncbi:MAG: alginate O-acetyltransferase [Pseudomonas sp.]|uniref:alginate O-acetyltransferase n=1 Tax=Pseudomonas sp. TaxID=306 RepID=UPI0027362237|nr:alginate O-acetyltransferase [Pseudomonas sp.]MDP3845016.1 alginate O-acetyltransferase [Pseudomonas sp.]